MAAHMSWLFSGEPMKQAGDHGRISCQTLLCGHIWMPQETFKKQAEGGRKTRDTQKEGEKRWMAVLKNAAVAPSHFHWFKNAHPGEAFWPGPSVCQWCFMSLRQCCNSCKRMPIYIPGVSFHYFYLHPAVSLPDWSGGSVQFKCPLVRRQVTRVKTLMLLYVCVTASLTCVT